MPRGPSPPPRPPAASLGTPCARRDASPGTRAARLSGPEAPRAAGGPEGVGCGRQQPGWQGTVCVLSPLEPGQCPGVGVRVTFPGRGGARCRRGVTPSLLSGLLPQCFCPVPPSLHRPDRRTVLVTQPSSALLN